MRQLLKGLSQSRQQVQRALGDAHADGLAPGQRQCVVSDAVAEHKELVIDLDLAVTAVSHPYIYSAPSQPAGATLFVRWPERHVYARHHAARIGLGTYDHAVSGRAGPPRRRRADWPEDLFGPAVQSAVGLLPERSGSSQTANSTACSQ